MATLTIMIVIAFVVGYACIATESLTKVNKAAIALLMFVACWTLYMFDPMQYLQLMHPDYTGGVAGMAEKVTSIIQEHLGDTSTTLFFLMGAMTIVEIVDQNGGFNWVRKAMKTKTKRALLWRIAFMTFILSAILDNLTTSIVMIMILRKLVSDREDRLIYAALVVIAANSGGAFSPIGDVTTIMLWVRGNISTGATIPHLLLPCLASAFIPTFIMMRKLKGTVTPPIKTQQSDNEELLHLLTDREKLAILIIGVLCLLGVPVFKTITQLPPFIGILMGVGILWFYTDIMYRRNKIPEDRKLCLSKVVKRIDGTTLLFFLGILLAVDVLRYSGVLGSFASWMDRAIGNVYVVNLLIGTLSAVIDNVPLVAGAIGMYQVTTDAMMATAADPSYLSYFVQDGVFWQFLAYCAGVGGSMIIIGSAAGVVVMGLEQINFLWYLRRISLLALIGYLAGAIVYIVQNSLF